MKIEILDIQIGEDPEFKIWTRSLDAQPFPEFVQLPYETRRDREARWITTYKSLRLSQDLWIAHEIAEVYADSFNQLLTPEEFRSKVMSRICVVPIFGSLIYLGDTKCTMLASNINAEESDLVNTHKRMGLEAKWTYLTSHQTHSCRIYL